MKLCLPALAQVIRPRIIFVLIFSLIFVGLASTTARVAVNYSVPAAAVPSSTPVKRRISPVEKQESLMVCPTTLTVDSDGDAADASPGDELCATAGAVCTLRAAIEESNALVSCSPVTIDFDIPGAGSQNILLGAALPVITRSVTIQGPTTSAETVTVDGDFSYQVFEVSNARTVNISSLTIVNGESGADSGGGLLSSGNATVSVSDSSFFGNDGGSSSGGGAIANIASGTLTLTNCTLASNNTGGDGGAIYASSGTINILNSTIVGNSALNVTANGGGIASTVSGTINLQNTIVALNFAVTNGNDVFGMFTSQGHNLISDGTGSTGFINGTNGDQVGTDMDPIDPRLDFPANNGGSTDTAALLPGSPAIDAGDDTGAPATDQRGVSRPQGNHVDIGAFELEGYVVNTTGDPGDGICTSDPGGCTLREAIDAANSDFPSPRLIAFNIPADDPGHLYYVTNSGSGVSAAMVAPTSSIDDAIPDIDPDYPHSWWSIASLTPLPDIENTVFINGYSQPGASVNTKHFDEGDNAILRIELNGTNLSSGNGLDLEFGAEGSTISGMIVNHFADVGIFVCGDGFNEVSGNFVGTDPSGTLAQGSTGNGINLTDGGLNLVGGDLPAARNLISGHGSGSGVDITSPDNILEGNYIGTDRNGLSALANEFGVRIHDGVEDNVIGCEVLDGSNLISGNTDSGVFIDNSDSNVVIGNFIGTNRTGTGAIANGVGVNLLDASDTLVAFELEGSGNVISGNTGDGILIKNSSPEAKAGGNIVQGNLIGTDKSGTVALANGGAGVEVDASSFNEIGCTVPEEVNVISGNTGHGVELTGGASFNLVQGNFIGVALNGTAALGNGEDGVEIYTIEGTGSSDNTIGPESSSDTDTDGVRSASQSSRVARAKPTDDVRFAANTDQSKVKKRRTRSIPKALIASRKALHTRLARRVLEAAASSKHTASHPFRLATLASLVLPSGLTAGANIIANNGGDGVKVSNPNDINNLITQNSIYANAKLGINLVGGSENIHGVTTNDGLDVDEGPNHLQNFPDITGADATTQTITGVLHSSPGDFQIDLYVNSVCDASGYGEGKTFIGSVNTTANGSGDAPYTFTSPSTPFTAGQIITATATQVVTVTATEVTRNTSEFSLCFTATGSAPPPVTPSFTKGPDQSVPEDSGAQMVLNWATDISPAADTDRPLTFVVQNNTNPSLFAAGPAVSSDGILTYTPAANANGAATITIVLRDDTSGNTSSPQTFVITVTEVNDPPTAVNDTLSNVTENSGQRTIPFATLTGNDSKGPANESGQSLIVKTVSSPVGGTVSIVGSTVRFTPTPNYHGPASFLYTVEDNGTTNGAADPLTSGTAQVSFTVLPAQPITGTNQNLVGSLAISEFRADGPNGVSDEYVEVCNISTGSFTILADDPGRIRGIGVYSFIQVSGTPVFLFSIPDGTVFQPGQCFLGAGQTFSLAGPGGAASAPGLPGTFGNSPYSGATVDALFDPDRSGTVTPGDVDAIESDTGVAVFGTDNADFGFNTSNKPVALKSGTVTPTAIVDAVGFDVRSTIQFPGTETQIAPLFREGTGLRPIGIQTIQYAFVRRYCASASAPCVVRPNNDTTDQQTRDVNDNTPDFYGSTPVAPTSTQAAPVTFTVAGLATTAMLGAPGPEGYTGTIISPIAPTDTQPSGAVVGAPARRRFNAAVATLNLSTVSFDLTAGTAFGIPNRERVSAVPRPGTTLAGETIVPGDNNEASAPKGTFAFRFTLRNQTGQTITRLRFRLVDASTDNRGVIQDAFTGSPIPATTANQAILRWISSTTTRVFVTSGADQNCTYASPVPAGQTACGGAGFKLVQGLVLEPTQPQGTSAGNVGGANTIPPGAPLGNGVNAGAVIENNTLAGSGAGAFPNNAGSGNSASNPNRNSGLARGRGTIILATPLANGDAISIEFRFGVQQNGRFYLQIVPEADGAAPPVL